MLHLILKKPYERNRHCSGQPTHYFRYELTLMKEDFLLHHKEVEQIYNRQRDLFDDLILNIKVSDLKSKPGQQKETQALENFALEISPMQMKLKMIG
jgi:hypothetical protein